MSKRRRRRRRGRRDTDIHGAIKKLRQAWFFLGKLERASTEMVNPDRDPERLDFYYSACLSAAQSVYYVLREIGGGTFREIDPKWRENLPKPERARFERMMGRRDDDVHRASTDAKTQTTFVTEEQSRRAISGFQAPHLGLRHAAIMASFGTRTFVEMKNPDGTPVSGPVLHGAPVLYIQEEPGVLTPATTACRVFIEQLTSLVKALVEEMRRKI